MRRAPTTSSAARLRGGVSWRRSWWPGSPGRDALAAFAPAVEVDTKPIRKEADVLRRRLEDMAEDYADGAMTREQFRTATEKARRRLADLEAEIAAAGAADVIAPLVTSGDVATAGRSSPRTASGRSSTRWPTSCSTRRAGDRTFRPETVEVDFRKRRSRAAGA
ncbi:hypothetical protein GS506_22315 [Rhodococcus hoagii]|nr:hypothetical protein [Prescottella equi]